MNTTQVFLERNATTVPCPVQKKQVPLHACEKCARGFIVRLTDGTAESVICHVPDTARVSTVGEIMSRRAIAVHPNMPIEQLILLFIDEDLSAVPVVNDQRRVVGVVSKTDLVFDDYEWAELRDEAVSLRRVGPGKDYECPEDLYVSSLFESRTVLDIMSDEPITVTADTDVRVAAKRMIENTVHSCPVVTADGTLLGMVSCFDVTRWVASRG